MVVGFLWIVFGPAAAWQLWNAYRYGEIGYGVAVWRRRERPVMFWFTVIVYCVVLEVLVECAALAGWFALHGHA
jgi:hypothetical protein